MGALVLGICITAAPSCPACTGDCLLLPALRLDQLAADREPLHPLCCQVAAGQVLPVGACLHVYSLQLCLPAMANVCSI